MAGVVVGCPECGAGVVTEPADAGGLVVCWRCGAAVAVPEAAPVAVVRPRASRRPPDNDDEYDEPRRRPRRRERVDATAVLSLVLGVLSCLLFCVWPLTLVTSLSGIVGGVLSRGSPSRKLAVSGLVLSSVGLTFAVGFLVLTVAGVSLIDLKGGPKVPPPFFPVHP